MIIFQALMHQYFLTLPLPTSLANMPHPPAEKQPIPASQDISFDFPLSDVIQPLKNYLIQTNELTSYK